VLWLDDLTSCSFPPFPMFVCQLAVDRMDDYRSKRKKKERRKEKGRERRERVRVHERKRIKRDPGQITI